MWQGPEHKQCSVQPWSVNHTSPHLFTEGTFFLSHSCKPLAGEKSMPTVPLYYYNNSQMQTITSESIIALYIWRHPKTNGGFQLRHRLIAQGPNHSNLMTWSSDKTTSRQRVGRLETSVHLYHLEYLKPITQTLMHCEWNVLFRIGWFSNNCEPYNTKPCNNSLLRERWLCEEPAWSKHFEQFTPFAFDNYQRWQAVGFT